MTPAPAGRVQVLHLLQQFNPGGGSQAALRAAHLTAAAGPFAHHLVSLLPVQPNTPLPAQTGTLRLTIAPTPEALLPLLAAADLVQVHFWNTPELYALLRAPWPPARVLLWAHVAGHASPQTLTPALLAWADGLAVASPFTADLPVVQAAPPPPAGRRIVFPVPDFARLDGLAYQPHRGYNVGYVGTVSFDKLHPDFVALHAAVAAPEARFIVAGSGGDWPRLRQQAEQLGVAARFDFRGYVSDLRGLFSTLDVFGYPLAPESYAAAELVLQEALYAGLPPVIFRPGAASRLVVHDHTGLIVDDAAGYRQALEHLYQHPEERARLSANARTYARAHFRADVFTQSLLEAYAALLALPKRPRAWPAAVPGPWPAAAAFVETLGDTDEARPFALSLTAANAPASVAETLAAEARIAAASPLLASPAAGGVLHYRRVYPADAILRLWAGLALAGQGRSALAVAEFTFTRSLGLDHWRVDWYLAQAAVACHADELAQAALARVLAAAPTFAPAVTLAARPR